MEILERITDDIKAAMKAKDKDRISVLRMVLSELKYAQSNLTGGEKLTSEAQIKAVQGYFKRLEKSLDEFPSEEQKSKIQAEMNIVEEYLPKKACASDIVKAIDEILANSNDRQFGSIMKQVMAKFGAASDGKLVSRLVKEKLG